MYVARNRSDAAGCTKARQITDTVANNYLNLKNKNIF